MSDKLTEWLTKPFLDENVDLPINIGDTVKMGKFKNKKVVVKSIDWNEKGDLLINGRPALKFRLMPTSNIFDETIEKVGDEYVVYPKKGGKRLGTHKTRSGAEKQLKAIEISKQNESVIAEGVNDPGIFKAVFLAGGPGSGKTYVAKQLFGIPDKFNISMSGMKMVNSDKELKYLLNKYGFGTDLDKMPDEVFKDLTSSGQSELRKFSKELTAQRMKLYQKGKLGMIIDGTGHDYSKLNKIKKDLEKDGYDTYMVFVNTSLEVAQKRNQERDRILPPKLLKDSWEAVQKNLGAFQSLFGKSNFISVDNNKHLSSEDAEKKFVPLVNKHIKKFVGYPITSKLAKKWIHKQQVLKKNESFDNFLVNNPDIILRLITESSTTGFSIDDGPAIFYDGFDVYKQTTEQWISDMYSHEQINDTGWEIINYILADGAMDPGLDYTTSKRTVGAIAYGKKGAGPYGERFGRTDPINAYKDRLNYIMYNLGWGVIKWMGITSDGKNLTGVGVESPVAGGVNVQSTNTTRAINLNLTPSDRNFGKKLKKIKESLSDNNWFDELLSTEDK